MIPHFVFQEGRMNMTVRELIVSKQISMKDIDFIAIVSNDGVVLNPAEQQAVWFGMHQLREEFLNKEVVAFSSTECDDVFSMWEDGPLVHHSFEEILIASENGNQLFAAMSLGDVVLYLVINETSDEHYMDVPSVNSYAV